MKILASDWLQYMASKTGDTPQSRIVALFEILHDWMNAPGLRQSIEPMTDTDHSEIKAYLLQLSLDAHAADAEALSSQLLLMLLGAIKQELQAPGCNALSQAATAVHLLLARHCKQPKRAWHIAVPTMAAVFATAVVLLPVRMIGPEIAVLPAQHMPAKSLRADAINPDKLAAVFHMHDEIRSAQCAYPQALMLPPEQRAIYLENVVSVSGTNLSPRALELVNQLYSKVECYYPPAALL